MTPLPPVPPPFGDPAQVQRENRTSVVKGLSLGCGGCALIVLVVGGVMGTIIYLIMAGIGSSDAVTQAFNKASASAEVKAVLGTPLHKGFMTTGSISTNYNNGEKSGTAEVSFSISGPKGSARVDAKAHVKNGAWIFTRLLVTPDSSGTPIDLLKPTPLTLRRPVPFVLLPA